MLTIREFAAHFRVSPDTVYRWIRSNRINAINVSTGKRKTYRIMPSELSKIGAVQDSDLLVERII